MMNILKTILLGSIALAPFTTFAADEINDQEHIEASEGLLNYKRFLLDENGKWSVGVGTVVRNSPFKGEKISVIPIPIIDYSSKNLFIRGQRMGYHIKRVENSNEGGFFFDGFLAPRVRPGDSRRKFYIDAGLGAGYQYGPGSLTITAQKDVTGRSDGTEVNVSYGITMPSPDRKNLFMPRISVTWQSRKLANFLWGIDEETYLKTLASEDELTLNPYELNSSVLNFNAGMTHVYRIDDHWNTLAMAQVTVLDNKITENPAVERRLDYSFIFGVAYTF